MALITAIAAGSKDATTTWSGGVVPGAADDVNLGGFLVTMSTSWSIASITDGGLVGSGLYVNTGALTLTVSGEINSTVAATQRNGNNDGTAEPTLINIFVGTGNFSLSAGVINSSGGACAVANMYNVFNASVGTINVSGAGTGSNASVGIKVYYCSPGSTIDIAGAASNVTGGYAIQCDGNSTGYMRNMTVTIANTMTVSGSNANGVSGCAIVNGSISSSANGCALVSLGGGGYLTINGNLTATDAVAAQDISYLVANGTTTVSGAAASGIPAIQVYGAALFTDLVVTGTGSQFYVGGALIVQSGSVQQTIPNEGIFIYADDMNLTFSGSGTALSFPSPPEVQDGVEYMLGMLGAVSLPGTGQVLAGVGYGPNGIVPGDLVLPAPDQVVRGVPYGPADSLVGDGPPAPPVVGAAGVGDLTAAVISVLRGDPVLTGASISGPSLQAADESKSLPYLVVQLQRNGKITRFLDASSVERYAVAVTVVAGSATQATSLVGRVHDIFDSAHFATGAGTVLQSYAQAAPAVRQVKHLSSGQPMYEAVVTVLADYYGPAS